LIQLSLFSVNPMCKIKLQKHILMIWTPSRLHIHPHVVDPVEASSLWTQCGKLQKHIRIWTLSRSHTSLHVLDPVEPLSLWIQCGKLWKHILIWTMSRSHTSIYMCLIQLSLFSVNPKWKIAEAYTNHLDTVKITYIHMCLIQLRPLLSEPNVWKIVEAYTNLDTVKITYILHVFDLVKD
jgi:hypothetical protein